MEQAASKRTRRVPSERSGTCGVREDEPLSRWLLSRPVPRELLIDVLRVKARYDRTSLVADAHAAHVRTLRRSRPLGERKVLSTHPPVHSLPTVVAIDAKEFRSSDPWSRRVPTVVDELQTLVEQVKELHSLADEITRSTERAGQKERLRAD
jgi:hypothetical protein